MVDSDSHSVSSSLASHGDTAAIRHLEQAIAGGRHWYLALLESIGLWTSAGEIFDDHTYCYVIDGEAFDWLLLAERLCGTVNGLLPEDDKNSLLFYGRPPVNLTTAEVKELIGISKYHQYLNYFYGVTVEEAIVLAVQEEIDKEKGVLGHLGQQDSTDEVYLRVYGSTLEALLNRFRQEKNYPRVDSITLSGLKEFTYWLFKYRLKQSEKARIASDTKKALEYLKRRWRQKGVSEVLSSDILAD